MDDIIEVIMIGTLFLFGAPVMLLRGLYMGIYNLFEGKVTTESLDHFFGGVVFFTIGCGAALFFLIGPILLVVSFFVGGFPSV
jgi:hypothetical protein